LLQQVYDPSSPNFHHYLSPAQFTAQFGPTEQDYEALADFASSYGLKVTGKHANRLLLDVSGSTAEVERAFHVKLRVYRHPKEARTFHAPDTEPSLELAVPVLAINGLDDFVRPRPMDLKPIKSEIRNPKSETNSKFQFPNAQNQRSRTEVLNSISQFGFVSDFGFRASSLSFAAGSGPRGAFLGDDFRAAYAPDVALTGTGQMVGLFELDGYFPGDIIAYESLAGLPNVPVTNILVGSFNGAPGPQNAEVALDIEMVIAMAPGLSAVLVYEGKTPNDVLNRMATDNLAKQLSSSWGFGSQTDSNREQILQEFAAQGQSFFQASGDFDAYSGAVIPPSDEPFAIVVGGTSLTMTNGAWFSETTWQTGTGYGSGGGISTIYPLPPWQQGVTMTANHGSTSKRNIPDVACVAEGIWVVVNNGEQGSLGGTSAAAPLWAAFTALANEQAAAAGLPSLGFLNPALYAIGKGPGYTAALHDITTGNNTNSSSLDNFFAVPGYDLCTGWGTPAGSNLIAALLAPPPSPLISPSASLTFTGPPGGPFTPAAQAFLLTNTVLPSLTWTLVNTSVWFNLLPTSGALAPGGPGTNVTVALTSLASNLPAGTYGSTVWFTNLIDQSVQSRQLAINVFAPPLITAQPANQAVFEGMTAVFSVGTTSNALLTYHWQYDNGVHLVGLTDGGDITGSTTSTLIISNVSSADVGGYSVIVSNTAGSVTSSNAFLTIVPWRPVITTQPLSQTVLPGQTVTLSVGAAGSQPLFYQWQANGTNLTDSGNISGSQTSMLTLANVSAANAGSYSVIVGNGLGLTPSSSATITVVTLTAPGTSLATLYGFTGGNDGAGPNGLLQAPNGNFYGTTANGGTNAAGSIFKMTAGGTFTSLYAFTGGNDGKTPFAPLALGPDGNFYGTAFQGGLYDNGTVFQITPTGAFTTVASFNGANGDLPYAGLTLGTDGNFYGSAYQGGVAPGNVKAGAVFRVTTNGTLSALVSFAGDTKGGFLHGGVVQGADGGFYGTTYKGGAFGYGTVFRAAPFGILTLVTSLDNTNGAFPYSGVVQGIDGNFYGTSSSGGSAGAGTLFRMSPAGQITNLYSFTGGSDGGRPVSGLLLGSDGNFYGTTYGGGICGLGTVFRIAPAGAMTTLAQFDGYNGAKPQATLTQGSDGSIYGTAQAGGSNGQGVIFRLTIIGAPQITSQPASQLAFLGATVLMGPAVSGSQPFHYQWQENGTNVTNGGNVSGSASRVLTFQNVAFANAGAYSVIVSNAFGSVTSAPAFLQLTSSPPVIVLQPTNQTLAPGATATFNVSVFGNLPLTYQWQQNGTNLVDGPNLLGSATSTLTITPAIEPNSGTYTVIVSNSLATVTSAPALLAVIPVSAAGTRLATLHSFTGGNDGGTPNGVIQSTNGLLFGTTQSGGVLGAGTLFRLIPTGALTTLAAFAITNGSAPHGPLAQGTDGAFYGTTANGGTNSSGTIFKLASDGLLTSLYSFTGGADGANPFAGVIQGVDGDFYGTAQNGGVSGHGTVFKLASTGAFATLYSFTNGLDGGMPAGELVQGGDGLFYGLSQGGPSGNGNAFKMTAAGTLANLYSFSGGFDGNAPAGALAKGLDGSFYGATKFSSFRGFMFYGSLFKLTTNGSLTTLYQLNTYDGHYPAAGVIQGSDGNLYGTTLYGGVNNLGTVFQFNPASGALTTLIAFDGFDGGANPAAALAPGSDGSFYGATSTGGPGGQGTVFRLSFAPQITASPANLTVISGADVTLSVAVFGTTPFTYQWLENGTNLLDGGNISGSSTPTLTITNVTLANAGAYSVTVTNSLGSASSAAAQLRVAFPPAFQSAAISNGVVKLGWNATAGVKYRLQFKANLTATVWTNLGNIIIATNALATASDPIGSNTRRFYRVVLLP
jgi:uncharacterized repeat protein (TIGR03803 family)